MVTFDQGSNHENTINTFIDVVDDLVVEGIETIVVSGSVASTSGSVPLSFVTGRDTTTITIADNDSKCWLFSLLSEYRFKIDECFNYMYLPASMLLLHVMIGCCVIASQLHGINAYTSH